MERSNASEDQAPRSNEVTPTITQFRMQIKMLSGKCASHRPILESLIPACSDDHVMCLDPVNTFDSFVVRSELKDLQKLSERRIRTEQFAPTWFELRSHTLPFWWKKFRVRIFFQIRSKRKVPVLSTDPVNICVASGFQATERIAWP